MLTQLALLPVLAVTITGVTTQTRDDGVTVDVTTSEPIAPGRIRPMTGHRLLYLFVDDTTPERETFQSGDRTITARERSLYTKLEIPMATGQRCYEPAEVRATPEGVSVQFSCSSKAGAGAGAVAQQEVPGPALRQGTQASKKSGRSEQLLQAALALPAEMPIAKVEDAQDKPATQPAAAEAKPSAPEQAVNPPTKPVVLAPTPAPATDTVTPTNDGVPAVQAKVLPSPAPLPAKVPSAVPAPRGPMLASTGGNSWFVMGVLLLVGAVGGMLAFTRRRARREGLIRILETAAIGPKRSLLVARINGRTMVLGASEAGIALLESIESKQAEPLAQLMGEPPPVREKLDPPVDSPAQTPNEAEGEMGVLSRLFRRRSKLNGAQDETAFRQLLAESYEDQELRERLSQGLVAKVS